MPKGKRLDDESRREFLRKSAYAAYATPVILAMLVEKASAAKSWCSNRQGDFGSRQTNPLPLQEGGSHPPWGHR